VLADHEVRWYDSDTATLPIATGPLFTTPELYDTTTYYLEEVYQDDMLWCISPRSSVTVFVIDTTSNAVPEFATASAFKVYPNPANDFLMLEGENATINGIEIYDSRGKLVFRLRSESLTRVNISALKPGEYFLRMVFDGGGVEVVKFMKM
jgi:hypothetical protein